MLTRFDRICLENGCKIQPIRTWHLHHLLDTNSLSVSSQVFSQKVLHTIGEASSSSSASSTPGRRCLTVLTEGNSLQHQLASTVISGHSTPLALCATHAAKTQITFVALPIPLVLSNSNFCVLLSQSLDPAPQAFADLRPGQRFCALMCLRHSQCPSRVFLALLSPCRALQDSSAGLCPRSAHLARASV